MGEYPRVLRELLRELAKLPGIGPRSAERIALHLLKRPAEESRTLSETVVQARERIRHCSRCFNFTEEDPCPICSDPRRDRDLLCVVEEAPDVLAIEKSHAYRGLYHVLRGRLAPLRGIGPEELPGMKGLFKRLEGESPREVILATGSDVDGEGTAAYLADILMGKGLKVTRIAHGIPFGSTLEYADAATLGMALEGRRNY